MDKSVRVLRPYEMAERLSRAAERATKALYELGSLEGDDLLRLDISVRAGVVEQLRDACDYYIEHRNSARNNQ